MKPPVRPAGAEGAGNSWPWAVAGETGRGGAKIIKESQSECAECFRGTVALRCAYRSKRKRAPSVTSAAGIARLLFRLEASRADTAALVWPRSLPRAEPTSGCGLPARPCTHPLSTLISGTFEMEERAQQAVGERVARWRAPCIYLEGARCERPVCVDGAGVYF